MKIYHHLMISFPLAIALFLPFFWLPYGFLNINGNLNTDDLFEQQKNSQNQITQESTQTTTQNLPKIPKRIALTFDDGPDKTYTPIILNALEQHSVHATFFVMGYKVKLAPELVKRAIGDGYEIGNHTWDHANLIRLSAKRIDAEISMTQSAINQAIGFTPKVFRPPYGNFNRNVKINSHLPIILWSVDPKDWQGIKAPDLIDYIINHVHNGDIILLHDRLANTAEAVPQLLDKLQAQGYQFETVSQLLGFDQKPALAISGKAYFSAYKSKT